MLSQLHPSVPVPGMIMKVQDVMTKIQVLPDGMLAMIRIHAARVADLRNASQIGAMKMMGDHPPLTVKVQGEVVIGILALVTNIEKDAR
jgi:hypothetical protein